MNRSIFYLSFLFIITLSVQVSAQELIPYRCVDADDLFSSGKVACKINFENKLDREAVVYWIDESGANIEYASLSVGESYTQATFISQRWLIADEQGNCLMVFVAASENQNGTIKDKYTKWNEVPPRGDLQSLPCKEDTSLHSLNSNVPTGIYFINKTSKTLKTYWLNYEGKRVYYHTIKPKSGYMQSTYVTHPWVITDEADECVCLFISESAGASNAIIEVLPENNSGLFVGKTMDKKINAGVKTFVEIIKEGSKDTVKVNTNSEGSFTAGLLPGRYTFIFSGKGILKSLESVEIGAEVKNLKKIFFIQPVTLINVVVIENVYFDQGKSEILPASNESLDKLYRILEYNPIKIQIEGHTDNQGNPDLNLSLSENRAVAIKKYLVSKGIDPKRITAKGFGGMKPIASNAKEETRKLNRRVEFRVVE